MRDRACAIIAFLVLIQASPLLAGPATEPSSRPHPRHLRADAPLMVKLIWYAKPEIKQQRLDELRVEMNLAKQKLTKIENTPPGEEYPDRQAKIDARQKQLAVIDQLNREAGLVKNADGGVPSSRDRSANISVGGIFRLASSRVIDVVDDHNVIVTIEDANQDLWLTDVKTDNLTDDSYVGGKVIVIVGTRRYETAIGGSRKILEAKPLRIEDYLID